MSLCIGGAYLLGQHGVVAAAKNMAGRHDVPSEQDGQVLSRIEFKPAAKCLLEKKSSVELVLKLKDSAVMVNGEKSEEAPRDSVHRASWVQVATDKYLEIDNGHPVEFLRRYRSSRGKYQNPPGERIPLVSEIEGLTVLFRSQDGADTRTIVSTGREEDHEIRLSGLVYDRDFIWLLPPTHGAREKWKLDPSSVLDCLAPDGLRVIMAAPIETKLLVPQLPADPQFWLDSSADGRSIAAVKRTKKGDGRDESFIELEFDLNGERDMRAVLDYFGVNPSLDQGLTTTLDYRGRGICWRMLGSASGTWDHNLGHMSTFELEASIEIAFSYTWSIPGERKTATRNENWAGTITQRVQALCR